jgi:hypothetical protein
VTAIAELQRWSERSSPTSTFDGEHDQPLPATSLTDERVDPELRIDDVVRQRIMKQVARQASLDESDRNWHVALRILTAWLRGLNFAQVSTVVGIPEEQLRRILHGELGLQKSKHERIERTLELTRRLRTLLAGEAIGDWFRTGIPALKNETPLEALRKRKVGTVEKLVASYFDPSYA